MDLDLKNGILTEQGIVDALADMIDQATATGDWAKLPFKPKGSCKQCHGKGQVTVTNINRLTQERITAERICWCLEQTAGAWFAQHSIKEIEGLA